jgi:hypothetical protein
MRNELLFAVMALAGLCWGGCARHSEKIVFLSETRTQLMAPAPVLTPSLSKAELAGVEQEVFSRLLAAHFADDGGYSAIFLQADEKQTASFMKQFPQHNPPIKPLWRSDIRPGFTPRDKDTGQMAMIFSVEAMDPENDSVTAIGRWYAGDAVKGFYSYKFKRTAAGWVIPPE